MPMIDHWLDSLTPRIVRRWAVRVLLVAAPIAIAAFIARAGNLTPEAHNATLMMTYAGGLMVAAVSVTVACLATCHLRIAGAFTAGYLAAIQGDTFEEDRRPVLTVVE